MPSSMQKLSFGFDKIQLISRKVWILNFFPEGVNRMNDKMMVQSCLAHCRNTKSDLQMLSSDVQAARAKDELSKAVQSIDACINQCQAALNNM